MRLPPGLRDFLPHATARRVAIGKEILDRFARWGYQRIITPQFEVAEVLERGLGPEAARSAIRFIEPELGEVALLRPDITPQVARIAATRLGEAGGPLRLSYEGTVVRQTSGARRQREILQAGVELIGASSPAGDSEMVALAAEVLLASAASECRLEIGHVGPVSELLADIEGHDLRARVAGALSRRDLSTLARLSAELPAPLATVLDIIVRMPPSIESLEEPKARAPAVVRRAQSEIRAVVDGARDLAPAAMKKISIVVDLAEVGSFPYYTGVRIAGWYGGVGDAVLVGGRYDKLVSRFGRDRKATGFAVDIELLAQAQASAGLDAPSGGGVLVVGAGERGRGISAALRRAGIRAALEIGGLRGRRAALRYAERAGFREVFLIAERGGEIIRDGSGTKVPETVIGRILSGNRAAISALVRRGRNR